MLFKPLHNLQMNKENVENLISTRAKLPFQSPFKQVQTKKRGKSTQEPEHDAQVHSLGAKIAALEEENQILKNLQQDSTRNSLHNEPRRIRQIQMLTQQLVRVTSWVCLFVVRSKGNTIFK
jgi:hypothetical protein